MYNKNELLDKSLLIVTELLLRRWEKMSDGREMKYFQKSLKDKALKILFERDFISRGW